GRERGAAQLAASFKALQTERLDLVQVHNLQDTANQLALLREQGRVLSAELAATWGISEDSVRRDLRELARQGLCRR
uniref:DeoR family transcriptional regulator n=1 Tax=Pseudomonas sp. DE0010 TaxID=2584951 RepID=UPI0021145ACE